MNLRMKDFHATEKSKRIEHMNDELAAFTDVLRDIESTIKRVTTSTNRKLCQFLMRIELACRLGCMLSVHEIADLVIALANSMQTRVPAVSNAPMPELDPTRPSMTKQQQSSGMSLIAYGTHALGC